MAQAIVTLKIMPDSPDTDLDDMEVKIKRFIVQFAGEGEMKIEKQPIAFGLNALQIIFVMDEQIGSTEELEKNIENIEGISSVEVTDVRRAIG